MLSYTSQLENNMTFDEVENEWHHSGEYRDALMAYLNKYWYKCWNCEDIVRHNEKDNCVCPKCNCEEENAIVGLPLQ